MSAEVLSSSSLRTLVEQWREKAVALDNALSPACLIVAQAWRSAADDLAALLSPVEGRHDKPEHVCGLSGFCPAPPHWDECPACNSKETK